MACICIVELWVLVLTFQDIKVLLMMFKPGCRYPLNPGSQGSVVKVLHPSLSTNSVMLKQSLVAEKYVDPSGWGWGWGGLGYPQCFERECGS